MMTDPLSILSAQYRVPVALYIAMARRNMFDPRQSVPDRFALLDTHYRAEIDAENYEALINKFAPPSDRNGVAKDGIDGMSVDPRRQHTDRDEQRPQ